MRSWLSRKRNIAILIVAVFAVLICGYAIARVLAHQPAPRHPVAAPHKARTVPPKVVVAPVVPGWQSVAGRDGSYAYDVPKNWTAKPDSVHGFAADANGPALNLARVAFFNKGFCPTDKKLSRAGSGVASLKAEPADAAPKVAASVSKHAYPTQTGQTVEPPQDAEVPLGDGRTRTATITLIEITGAGDACHPAKALVGALALNASDATSPKSAVMIVYADEAVIGKDELLRILHSYRGVPPAQRTTVAATPPPTK